MKKFWLATMVCGCDHLPSNRANRTAVLPRATGSSHDISKHPLLSTDRNGSPAPGPAGEGISRTPPVDDASVMKKNRAGGDHFTRLTPMAARRPDPRPPFHRGHR